MENEFDFSALLDYVEPNVEEKAALIARLQSGDFSLSYSSIQAFDISPRAFVAYKVRERKETAAMLLGSLVHCLVLEPDEYKKRYIVGPDVNASTAEGKNKWGEFWMEQTGVELKRNKQENFILPKIDDIRADIQAKIGLTVVGGSVDKEAKARARALAKNDACKYVLNQITQTEIDIPDGFELFGYKFRGRIDGQGPDVRCDLKNIVDASRYASARHIQYSSMAMQAYIYERAFGHAEYYILCVDGNGETSAHCLSREQIVKAGEKLEALCHSFYECIDESFSRPEVWDMSQDFWFRTKENPHGIHYFV